MIPSVGPAGTPCTRRNPFGTQPLGRHLVPVTCFQPPPSVDGTPGKSRTPTLRATTTGAYIGSTSTRTAQPFRHINDAFLSLLEMQDGSSSLASAMAARRACQGNLMKPSHRAGADASSGSQQHPGTTPDASFLHDESSSQQPRTVGPDANAVRLALRLVHMPPERSTQVSAAYVERFGKKREPHFVRSISPQDNINNHSQFTQPQHSSVHVDEGHQQEELPMMCSSNPLSAGLVLGNSEICPDDIDADPPFLSTGDAHMTRMAGSSMQDADAASLAASADETRTIMGQINGRLSDDAVDGMTQRI